MTSKFMLVFAAYLHVIGVAVYLGGSVVMELVVGPAQKAIPPAQAQVMGEKTANRFLILVWSALGLILASGLLRLFAAHNADILVSERLFSTDYGRTLLMMVFLWCVLVINGLLITFWLRPKLSSRVGAMASTQDAQKAQSQKVQAARRATWLSRADLVIVFIIALLGSSLGYGGIV